MNISIPLILKMVIFIILEILRVLNTDLKRLARPGAGFSDQSIKMRRKRLIKEVTKMLIMIR